jgi:hypothetical protein
MGSGADRPCCELSATRIAAAALHVFRETLTSPQSWERDVLVDREVPMVVISPRRLRTST